MNFMDSFSVRAFPGYKADVLPGWTNPRKAVINHYQTLFEIKYDNHLLRLSQTD